MAKSTFRTGKKNLTANVADDYYFSDTEPNHIVVSVTSGTKVYVSYSGTASASNYDAVVPANGTKLVARPNGTDRISLMALGNCTVIIDSFNDVFGASSVTQTIEVIQAGAGGFGDNVNIAGFGVPLPAGANEIGSVVVQTAQYNALAKDGTDATGVSQLTGGVGIRGWLSGIFKKLADQSTTITDGTQKTQVTTLPALPAGTNTFGYVGNVSQMTQPPETAQITLATANTAVQMKVGAGDLANRKTVMITNLHATDTMFVGKVGVTTGTGFPVKAGQTITLDQKTGSAAAVYAVSATAAHPTAILEMA